MKLYGGIEAGGTKFVCAVSESGKDGQILAETRFPTGKPEETFPKVIEFFKSQVVDKGSISAIGIASFGPLDPRPGSETYGYITSTPKPGWANYNFVGAIQTHFDVPILIDTDVDGAALGEWRWGEGKDLDSLVYLTIGTGIGGGAITNGEVVHGLLHTEMGHMRIPHSWEKDPFDGVCPYHGDCLEGLACGIALEKRWGRKAENLPKNHPGWELEAGYLAYALVNLILTLSPQRIILGGGVMSQEQLFPLIRKKVIGILNGYLKSDTIVSQINNYIVPPGLGPYSGVKGALVLAEIAYQRSLQ